jgi:hypothetical protein
MSSARERFWQSAKAPRDLVALAFLVRIARGNQYRIFKGFLVVVFPSGDGWSGQIKEIASR